MDIEKNSYMQDTVLMKCLGCKRNWSGFLKDNWHVCLSCIKSLKWFVSAQRVPSISKKIRLWVGRKQIKIKILGFRMVFIYSSLKVIDI